MADSNAFKQYNVLYYSKLINSAFKKYKDDPNYMYKGVYLESL